MSVGWAPRAVRVSSRAPSCSSSRATRRDSTGLDRPMRSAARANEPVSTTRTKDRTSTRSVEERSIFRNPAMPGGRLPATHLADYIRVTQSASERGNDMNNILILTSSAQGPASVSTRIADEYEALLRLAHQGAEIVRRDIGAEPIPHLVAETVAGIRGTAETEAEKAALALSDSLVAELQAADLVVIASPMYNFGMSSTLKSWFDHVLRARVTCRYTEAGPEGLLKDKKAVVIESRGGLYSEGAAAA